MTVQGRPTGRILLTGASGFVGSHLLDRLVAQGATLRLLARRPIPGFDTVVSDLARLPDLNEALRDVDAVVHCAGLAHAHSGTDESLARRYDEINHRASVVLGDAAARAGVRRFVFCSSVKAVAESPDHCVREDFAQGPTTPYGRSKRDAEEALARISAATGMDVLSLRLAAVYGPGSRGNLERMFRLVQRGCFPPIPETHNRRSFVYIDDVISAIELAIHCPTKAGGCYHVAHPGVISGRALFQAMRRACGRREIGWSVPAPAWRLAAAAGESLGSLLGRRMPIDRAVVSALLDSAWYDSSLIRERLGWEPRFDIMAGLEALHRHMHKETKA